jgi:hypothetical protein
VNGGSAPVRQTLRAAVVATAALLFLRQGVDVDQRRLMAFYLAALAAVAVVLVLRLLSDRHPTTPSRFERVAAGNAVEPMPPPRGLRVTQRALVTAGDSAGGAHGALRPVLADVVAERLAVRHGIGIGDPRAAGLVDPELWELVRPDRPPPEDRHGRGLGPAQLERLVDQLEGADRWG